MPRPMARAVAMGALMCGAAAAVEEVPGGQSGGSADSEVGAARAEARALGVRTWVNNGFTCRSGLLPNVPDYRPEGPKVQVRVLTFNLFWWMLFDKGKPGKMRWHLRTPGNGATALVNHNLPFDILGFTECFDEHWLLQHAGLATEYRIFRDVACCMAYRHTIWDFISKGVEYPTADKFGRRPAQWMRLKHKGTGQTVLFTNHHGPLPLNSGGLCGPGSTAYRMLQLVNEHRGPNDAVISVGDFNADGASDTVRLFSQHLRPAFSNGLDRIFTNMPAAATLSTGNLGSGGSDHNALVAVFELGGAPPPPPPPPTATTPPAPAPDEGPPFGYQALERVVLDEGGPAGDYTARYYSVAECAHFCDESPACQSFSHAGSTDGWCHLKDKCVASGDPVADQTPYRTYYKPCAASPEGPSRGTPAEASSEVGAYAATGKVLADEGPSAGDHTDRHYSVSECSALCDSTPACHSFSYAGAEDGWCHLKVKCVTAQDPETTEPTAYRTYYKSCGELYTEGTSSADTLQGDGTSMDVSPLVDLAALPPAPEQPRWLGGRAPPLAAWPELLACGMIVVACVVFVHRVVWKRFTSSRNVRACAEGDWQAVSADEESELR